MKVTVMSGKRERPTRNRRAPERYGAPLVADEEVEAMLARVESEEEQESEEEELPRSKRQRKQQQQQQEAKKGGGGGGRRGRAAAAPAEEDEDEEEAAAEEDSDASEAGSSEEEEVEERRQPAAKRRAAAAPKADKPYVPAPPKQPRLPDEMLGLLFACPTLIDALLEPDGLRTITLVARDAAHLAAALGARSDKMTGLWTQLARRCDPRFAGSVDEALAVVRRAVRADPARSQRLVTKTAATGYRVSRTALQGLSYQTRYSYSFGYPQACRMYSKLDVLAIAHRKYGHAAVLAEEKAKVEAKRVRNKETREGREEQRRKELTKALLKAGLEHPTSRDHTREGRRTMKDYIKRGRGNPADIVKQIKSVNEAEDARKLREQLMDAKLKEEGLQGELWGATAQRWIAGTAGEQSLEQAVVAIKAAKQEVEGRGQRRERIAALLTEQGLAAFVPQPLGYGGGYRSSAVPGLDTYIQSGTGSEQAVLEAARELHAAAQAKEQRRAALTQALAAEGLQGNHLEYTMSGIDTFVRTGAGSIEELVAAVREKHAAAAAHTARRQQLEARLAAEGLQEYVTRACYEYIDYREGTEDEAVAQARKLAAADAARAERRAAVGAVLEAEGIPFESVRYVPAVRGYLDSGDGTLETALALAHNTHQEAQARQQRRVELEAAMQAAGLRLRDWGEYGNPLPGLDEFLAQGVGSTEELVAQAKAIKAAGGLGYVV